MTNYQKILKLAVLTLLLQQKIKTTCVPNTTTVIPLLQEFYGQDMNTYAKFIKIFSDLSLPQEKRESEVGEAYSEIRNRNEFNEERFDTRFGDQFKGTMICIFDENNDRKVYGITFVRKGANDPFKPEKNVHVPREIDFDAYEDLSYHRVI